MEQNADLIDNVQFETTIQLLNMKNRDRRHPQARYKATDNIHSALQHRMELAIEHVQSWAALSCASAV